MGSVDRLTRVNELLKREIAEFLERNPLAGCSGMLVSVTMVKCSVDLRNATVFVSVFGGKNYAGRDVIEQLRAARCDIQSAIGSHLKFKHTPVLEFKLDDRLSRGDRVLEILDTESEQADEPQD